MHLGKQEQSGGNKGPWSWDSALLTFVPIPATSQGSRMRKTSWFGKYPQQLSCPNPVPETIFRLTVSPDFFCCCSIDVDVYLLLENQNNNSTNKDSSFLNREKGDGPKLTMAHWEQRHKLLLVFSSVFPSASFCFQGHRIVTGPLVIKCLCWG